MIKELSPQAKPYGNPTSERLTQKCLMERWKCSLRTVQREIRRWGLEPADFIGIQPIFTEKAVVQMEAKRLGTRAENIGLKKPGRILTVREAKRLAGRKGGK